MTRTCSLYGTSGIKIKKVSNSRATPRIYRGFLSSESERVVDGVALQRLLHQLRLLLHVHRVEARRGGRRWGPAHVLDVLDATPAQRLHRRQQAGVNVAVRTHVHRLLLAPHDLGICTTETQQDGMCQLLSCSLE